MISADVVYMREEMLRQSHNPASRYPVELPRAEVREQVARWARAFARRRSAAPRAVPVRALLEAVADGDLSPEAAARLLRKAA